MEIAEYNKCVKEWADALFRFACKCTGQPDDAHDVVQSSFEVLWQKRKEVEAAKGKAFLFQVAYRHSINNYRKKARISYTEVPEESYSHGNPDLKKILDRALEQLDDQSRALVLLKDYEGYRYEEIAQITGLSDSQVKVYLHRARKVLKEYLVSVENVI
jgi:RNA polymerase sigma factor (sigma-70 family)